MMTTTDPRQIQAREIIEEAMAKLRAMGMTADGAASLLCIQGAVRVEDKAKRKSNVQAVAQFAEDVVDDA
ncbi:hypothetical protein EOA75_03935 [Mesorhizobium sp. M1A.F.Ca.IN.022.07.1.1]|uniref:hypothetical protein n=1 Tax=Mesorhizobium sp. M1A.F.Ca.IN.022.07.1.1 TaxID=2496767 RepID=UPI000FCB9BF7|nr:hypothetical protein [Mesorhizobium sp. M1A.F.Ca.IN.022.07.1.1]RUV97362.1 hypothetical protein EOA75_03935 [Mesorhizobium sp. M1A.F.Ca.IN.022.07.1.1]TIS50797.1 MAG: hypothetical protein E5X11_16645 [Mesorhizobium sp.]